MKRKVEMKEMETFHLHNFDKGSVGLERVTEKFLSWLSMFPGASYYFMVRDKDEWGAHDGIFHLVSSEGKKLSEFSVDWSSRRGAASPKEDLFLPAGLHPVKTGREISVWEYEL